MRVQGFDWDDGNVGHAARHGVAPAWIEALFSADGLMVLDDVKHAQVEKRMLAIGEVQGRWIFCAFTFRERGGDMFIRPISARFMHDEEVERYAAR